MRTDEFSKEDPLTLTRVCGSLLVWRLGGPGVKLLKVERRARPRSRCVQLPVGCREVLAEARKPMPGFRENVRRENSAADHRPVIGDRCAAATRV